MSNNLKHDVINNLHNRINSLEQQLEVAKIELNSHTNYSNCNDCSNGITIPVTSIKEEAIVEDFLEIYKKQDFQRLEEALNAFKH
tara:strand:+ start:107 stop:361 length:255 start_codon:yes stop_codon:yes gene_type:complete